MAKQYLTSTKKKISNLQEVLEKNDGKTVIQKKSLMNIFDSYRMDGWRFQDIHSLQKRFNGVEEVYHCAAKK